MLKLQRIKGKVAAEKATVAENVMTETAEVEKKVLKVLKEVEANALNQTDQDVLEDAKRSQHYLITLV
jgi:aspartyl-tRNA synthetase